MQFIKKSPKTISVVFALLLSAISTANAAPIYDVQAGVLQGIQHLEINGVLYDVTFVDGEVQTLYDLSDPFFFAGGSQASDATQALALNLLDVIDGNFDTNPLLVNGCAADNCRIHVPYIFSFGNVTTEYFRNAANEADDERGSTDLLPTFNSVGTANTFTQWRLSDVPEPSSSVLMLMGLLMLGFVKHRQS